VKQLFDQIKKDKIITRLAEWLRGFQDEAIGIGEWKWDSLRKIFIQNWLLKWLYHEGAPHLPFLLQWNSKGLKWILENDRKAISRNNPKS